MSDAFVMMLMGGAYSVVVFLMGALFEHWRHDGQQMIADEREQAIIETMAQGQGVPRVWSIPDDEQ